MSGYIVYEGHSMFDKKPIVAILTMKSGNAKTGNMAQLWILRSDIEPHLAVKFGNDQSVCGGCKHRHFSGGACYVLPFQGPLSVYRSYKRGNYSKLTDLSILSKYKIRLGAYGDPLMIPSDTLSTLRDNSRGTTGYSHQWKINRLSSGMEFCQGSVDSLEEAKLFKEMYPTSKYFRVTSDISDIQNDEVQCPADTHGTTCMECMMCDGKTQNIVIEIHGAKKSKFKSDIKVVTV